MTDDCRNYYNEIDPDAAAVLRAGIADGIFPDGDVDERSIEDVKPHDLDGYTQCHFFAGTGGWILALDLAGWPRNRRVWTGSCPCQPFSSAGKGLGLADERHLWPAWLYLIDECGPPDIVGEQVASSRTEPWIDLIHADLEGLGYAFGGVAFPAASIGAPFIGDRFYWAAVSAALRHQQPWQEPCGGTLGRMGWQQQPVPWDEPVLSALARIRVLDDGLPRLVAGTDAARNAIVPQQGAAFVSAYMACMPP